MTTSPWAETRPATAAMSEPIAVAARHMTDLKIWTDVMNLTPPTRRECIDSVCTIW